MEDFKSILSRVKLNLLIEEMVLCDLEKYVTDLKISKISGGGDATFILSRNAPEDLIKYIKCIFKEQIEPMPIENGWQIIFYG